MTSHALQACVEAPEHGFEFHLKDSQCAFVTDPTVCFNARRAANVMQVEVSKI